MATAVGDASMDADILVCGEADETMKPDVLVCGGVDVTMKTDVLVCGGGDETMKPDVLVCGGVDVTMKPDVLVCGGDVTMKPDVLVCGGVDVTMKTDVLVCGGGDETMKPDVLLCSGGETMKPDVLVYGGDVTMKPDDLVCGGDKTLKTDIFVCGVDATMKPDVLDCGGYTTMKTYDLVKKVYSNSDSGLVQYSEEEEIDQKTVGTELHGPTNISEAMDASVSPNHLSSSSLCKQTGQLSLAANSQLGVDQGAQPEINPSIRINMLARIAVSDAHFKHQQRGEPDLTMLEKIEIAQNVLDSNKVNFLSRFGKYLEFEDLEYFKDWRDVYEVDFYIKQIVKSKSGTFERNRVKNRRYEAMKELISKDEYFSEEEMKFRDPFLYEQMVGIYLTGDEVQAKVDKSDLKFSTILLAHVDQLDENMRYYQDKDKEEGQEEEEEETDDEESEMEDDDEQECGEDDVKKKISDAHKQELKTEFLTLMQERFLRGEDEGFDYSKVDNNEAYDDMAVVNLDEEQKYFDDEDPESINSDSNL